jgi:dCMP deaminase
MTKEEKWNRRYMDAADFYSSWSEDPKKQVGAVIVRNNRILSYGYNGFPTGVSTGENGERLEDREKKLDFIVHAEMNAVVTAAKMGHKVDKSTMYCNFFPCPECAKAIIQSGIERLVTVKLKIDSKWHKKMLVSLGMLTEAKIKITFL